MKQYELDNLQYQLLENYKDGFDIESAKKLYTEYFHEYDYILGDWSYGKLRLKGFCDSDNSLKNNTNDILNKDKYVKEYCAYDCKYFILKKIK